MTTTNEPTTATDVAALYVPVAVGGVLALYERPSTPSFFLSRAAQTLHVSRAFITSGVEVLVASLQPFTRVIGKGAEDFSERDMSSLQTVIEDADSAQVRIERFVRSTLTQYARDEYLDIAAEYGAVGWVWRADGANCDYCTDRDGQEYGLEVEFRDHPNCNCYPEATF